MLKPICVKCRRFYRMKKSGYWFTEGMPVGGDFDVNPAPRGTAAPERWQPYKVWVGDLWVCNGCDHHLISGVGLRPHAEHYMEGFEATRAKFGADQLQINDC